MLTCFQINNNQYQHDTFRKVESANQAFDTPFSTAEGLSFRVENKNYAGPDTSEYFFEEGDCSFFCVKNRQSPLQYHQSLTF